MQTTSQIIEHPVDILMNAYEGVNLSVELGVMYNNFISTDNYKSLSELDKLKCDSLFAHTAVSFNAYCAELRGYSDDNFTCQKFMHRTANLLTLFDQDYVVKELSMWLNLFQLSARFDKMNSLFERENFVFRAQTLIGFIRDFGG